MTEGGVVTTISTSKVASLEKFMQRRNVLCFLMTFRRANDLDTQRLELLEEHCKAAAYSCSIQDSLHERHINCSITNRKLRNEIIVKWGGVRFHQVCFDWRNMPDRYLKNNIRSVWIYKTLVALTKDMLQPDGAIFLPFIMTYYVAVAVNLDELSSAYEVDFLTDSDEALDDVDLITASREKGITNLSEYTRITLNHLKAYDLGNHSAVVMKHFSTLVEPENIRMIRLQWKNKALKAGNGRSQL
jgi:hypothetical protein